GKKRAQQDDNTKRSTSTQSVGADKTLMRKKQSLSNTIPGSHDLASALLVTPLSARVAWSPVPGYLNLTEDPLETETGSKSARLGSKPVNWCLQHLVTLTWVD